MLSFTQYIGFTKSLPALLVGFLCFGACLTAQAEDYLSTEEFLAQVFSEGSVETKSFWLTGERKTITTDILQHPPNKLRQRYWQQGTRTAWVMDEIGKEKPITVGVVINGSQIEQVKVLSFRESRGWEVRYPFFVKQYNGASLAGDNALSKPIDNITGATLSVRAVNKLARLALLYHSLANTKSTPQNVSQPPR